LTPHASRHASANSIKMGIIIAAFTSFTGSIELSIFCKRSRRCRLLRLARICGFVLKVRSVAIDCISESSISGSIFDSETTLNEDKLRSAYHRCLSKDLLTWFLFVYFKTFQRAVFRFTDTALILWLHILTNNTGRSCGGSLLKNEGPLQTRTCTWSLRSSSQGLFIDPPDWVVCVAKDLITQNGRS
jgi:hypothetical protein